jgi:hypothetical protein
MHMASGKQNLVIGHLHIPGEILAKLEHALSPTVNVRGHAA